MKKQFPLFVLLFYSIQSFAITDSTKIASISDVTILSNRLLLPFEENNFSIQIIDRKTIELMAANSIAEVLAYANGIDIRQRGPNGVQSDVSINGGTFDQTLVLINGIKIIDPQTGHHIMNLPVALSSIERIEILKGAAARRYGINAINGAINIITKKNIDKSSVLVELSGGSNFNKDTSNNETYHSYTLGLSANFKIKKSSNLLSVLKQTGNGYRYNTAYDNHKVLYQYNANLPSNQYLTIFTGYVNNQFGANSFYASPADKNSFEKVETFIGVVDYSKAIRRFLFNPKFSYRYNDDDYIFIKQNPEVYRNNHYSHSYNAELNTSYRFQKSFLAMGIEMRNEKLRSNNLGNRERVNLGINLEHRITFFYNRLKIVSGIYVNHNNSYGTKALPGIDVGYQFTQDLNMYANWGAGQRIPTYTDLYYTGPSNIGNVNLRPEESFSQELGLKFKRTQIQSNISLFSRNIHHFIDWTKANANDAWQVSNFNQIKTSGLSIENIITVSPYNNNWSLKTVKISYTHLKSKLESDSSIRFSRYVIENLRDQLVTQLNFNLLKNTSLNISHRYQNRVNYKDYNLVDFRLSYTWHALKINIDGNNIFDEKFEEIAAVPMVGKWWDIGITYQIH